MQRKDKQQSGFTIVEVLLFLAITGLLFLIGFWGTGNQVTSVRFTDSMRSLDSFLQQQLSLVATGANPRAAGITCNTSSGGTPAFGSGSGAATAGEEDDCILLGKFMSFNPDSTQVRTYYVVGKRLPLEDLPGDDAEAIAASEPVLSPQATGDYTIDWQTHFFQPSTEDASNQSQTMAILRSPSSGKLVSFAFPQDAIDNTFSPSSEQILGNVISSRTDIFADDSGYCFEGSGNDRSAIIKFGYGQRADSIELEFSEFSQQNDCVRSQI